MQIDSIIDLRANVYHVEIHISALTSHEKDLVAQFGAPVVETGGVIATNVTRPGSNSPVAVSYTLPTAPRRLPDEFPAKHAVSLADDENADVKVQAYKVVIEQRIAAAKTALIAKAAYFVGETRTTI